ncbi:MAG: hypothetical protein JO328_02535 [Hyphomicrobiales bacterium]|nr:hypothetical protein [Hyphomicrobiales bacterium]
MNDLLAFTVEAHGGLERWDRVASLRMRGHMGGLGLLHSAYDSEPLRTAHISATEPWVSVNDFPEPGDKTIGTFADKVVRIERADGSVIVRSRDNARDYFLYYLPRLKRWFWYDQLDVTYFLGYAIWNYLLTPFLFTRPGFSVEEGEPLHLHGRKLRRLIVKFPDNIPTHSPEQVFFINEKGLINYFTYTVEIVGPWVNAVHYCRSYRDFGGIKVPTRRRAILRHDHFLRNWRIRKNVAMIMWGNLHEVEFINKEQ